MTLEQHLVDSGIVTTDQLKRIMEYAAEKKCTNLAAARECIEDDASIVQAVCEYFKYSYIRRGYGIEIDTERTSRAGDIFDLTDRKSFIAQDKKHRFVLLYDPTDDRIRQRLLERSDEEMTIAMCGKQTYEAIYELSVQPALLSIRAERFKEDTSQKSSVQAATTAAQDLLDDLLTAAIAQRASDIHIMPLSEHDGLVRLRVDGVLRDYACISSAVLPMLRQLLINKIKIGGDTVNKPIEGQFDFPYDGGFVDTRVNVVNAKLGPDFNLRFIRSELKCLEDIGLSDDNKAQYRKLLQLTKGMVIVTGPTGSGKSTLLYAGCREIAGKEKSIFAIEDPVEIVMPQSIIGMQRRKDQMPGIACAYCFFRYLTIANFANEYYIRVMPQCGF